MSERVADKMGAAGIIALATAAILLYSLWGAGVMQAQKQPQLSASQEQQLARGN